MIPISSGRLRREQFQSRVLVDTLADKDLTNAQMINGRDIISRLDPDRFHVSVFHLGEPDPRIEQRPNTRLIQLPTRRQTFPILREFLLGEHDILFYVKSSPATKWYLKMRSRWKDRRVTVGTIESRSDLRSEPTIASQAVGLWEQTVLRSDYLFSNSQATKTSLGSEYGRDSEIVPTGVDTTFFTPNHDRAPTARVRVLFVGSLRPFKQPDLVVEAASRFPHTDFAIVGAGPMAEDLLRRAQTRNLANVALLGTLSPHEVRAQYRQADIFFFPSTWEGSPRVIMEAAACGLPVIVRKDYQPETVISEETGFLAESNGELLARLGCLIHDPELRRTMGAAGRKHIAKFDWDPITRQWQEIFVSLAPPGARAS